MSDVSKTVPSGASRRSVVRTAAHAAWAVPAIQFATSAPAFADSRINDIVNPQRTLGTAHNPVTVTNISVTNDGPNVLGANTVRLTLTVTGANPAGATYTNPTSTGLWAYLSGAGTGTIIFAYTGTVAVGTNVSLTGSVSATLGNNSGTSGATLSYVGPA